MHAWEQMEAIGVSLAEVYRVLREPQETFPATEGTKRFNGYGLSVVLAAESEISSVQIDGADGDNWSDWAVERAAFADSDVATADALVRREVVAPRQSLENKWERPKDPNKEYVAPTAKGHIMDSIHPSLRAEITRLVDGDFSRLVVHSATNIDINPPRR